jgi:glycosyltransferase involved in cell wall biosynthesis
MRIVYVLASLGMGGAERQVLALAARMAERGHTVALMVLRAELNEEWPTAIAVTRLKMRRNAWSVLMGMARGRRFLRTFKPDVVHSHSFHANFVARLLGIFVADAKIVSTIHNVYEGGWARMLAYRLTDGLSDVTTAVSTAAAERFMRLKAVRSRGCRVVMNGIDVLEFAPATERRAAMRAGMSVEDEFVWLTVGRMVAAKDFPNLLRAFERVRQRRPDAQLWIAGEGASGREEGGVRWLGLRRDVPALMDAADGFVLSSAWEGMPLVVGEAMAMERPVVATDVGGVRELVGDAGVLVAARDSEALAGAMLAVMERGEAERRELGRRARARIEDGFSMEARGDEWEGLYLGPRH